MTDLPHPPFVPRPGDLTIAEAQQLMEQLIEQYGPGTQCYVKWTCPGCGDRCSADDANTIHTSYIHTERADGTPCGTEYRGGLYGVRMLTVLGAPVPPTMGGSQ